MLIAFDIDGTLADLTHRLHFIKDTSHCIDGTEHTYPNGTKDPYCIGCHELPFKPDWDSFFAACDKDEPIHELLNICQDLLCAHNEVIFVSGRSDSTREATVAWLNTQLHLPSTQINNTLYMRSEGDHRPDYIIKRELLDQIILDYGKKPDLVFDDRQQVVDMFRSEGIRVCQVDKGNF